jgi:hypothetical protein
MHRGLQQSGRGEKGVKPLGMLKRQAVQRDCRDIVQCTNLGPAMGGQNSAVQLNDFNDFAVWHGAWIVEPENTPEVDQWRLLQ